MEQRNTIIAVALSAVIMLGWFYFFSPKKVSGPVSTETSTVEQQGEEENTAAASEDGIEVIEEGIAEKAGDESGSTVEELAEVSTEEKIQISTKFYNITLTNRGASISSLLYGEREIELVVPYKNFSPRFDFSFHYTEKSFLNGPTLDKVLWHVQEQSEKRVVFAKNIKLNGKVVTAYKIYEFVEEEYYFNLSYVFKNANNEKVYFPENKVIFSTGEFLGPRMPKYDGRYNKVESIVFAEKKKKLSKGGGFFKKASDTKRVDEPIEWAGVLSRYFALLLYTDNNKADAAIADTRAETGNRTGLIYEDQGINPGTKNSYSFKVCLTEKRKEYLKSVNPVLESASDTNKFIDPIRVLVIWSLKQLNKFIPNFGLCLIIFSIFTKLVFLPLTAKSTESMKKMSALQPEIQKIKDKYKDKPEEMQKKTMELYKEKGVNPMGGCLPMIVQMPFFIALYSALSNSLDMWETPFVFWITDLSRPDTIATISGFDINILPLFMTVTSFLQQKMTTVDTGSANNQQQMMMKFMPLFLLFIFWSMPSGLILYWTVQNILQVGHQLLVNRKK